MMKSLVSAALSSLVTQFVATPIAERRYPAMSVGSWSRLPTSVQKWFGYRVMDQAEEEAKRAILSDPGFSRLLEGLNLDWALSFLSLQILVDTMRARNSRQIVEFGSGLSTTFLAHYAQTQEASGKVVPQIYSFDHHEDWLKQTRSKLASLGLDSYVNLQHAPLTEQKLLGRSIVAYTIPEETRARWLSEQTRFDLCLIDGPPGEVGRAGSLPIVAGNLAESAIVFLDDSFRVAEQEILTEWGRAYNGSFGNPLLYLTLRHGLAAVDWKGNA